MFCQCLLSTQEASWVHADIIFSSMSLLILHRIKTLGLSTQINSFHTGWNIKNIAWECEIWILGFIMY